MSGDAKNGKHAKNVTRATRIIKTEAGGECTDNQIEISTEHSVGGNGLAPMSSIRRLARNINRQLSRRQSSLQEALPETYPGWAALLATLSAAAVGYEIRLQKRLTGPPLVFGQCQTSPRLSEIYARLTASPSAILRRDIQPSLFVGTRASVASTFAYLLPGPSRLDSHPRFREILTMPADGAKVAIDWELPPSRGNRDRPLSIEESAVRNGPIKVPVVVILHGINNHANFGYIRSLMRVCTDKGWIAAGLNFRGCGGLPLATPRGYNGAYTGDLRAVVQTISGRLAPDAPLLLVGNSLGANLVAKYLGEEGLSNTLPPCVIGGVTLGNPMRMNAGTMDPALSSLLALGAKKTLLENWPSMKHMTNSSFRGAVKGALLGYSLADFDSSLAPLYVRNDPIFPYALRLGFQDGEAYWKDASSYRFLPFVSVPLLQIIAGDDFLVYHPFTSKVNHAITNPNVMVVETKCGGHLGWQESQLDVNAWGVGTSWADVATVDFLQAVMDTHTIAAKKSANGKASVHDGNALYNRMDATDEAVRLRSRL